MYEGTKSDRARPAVKWYQDMTRDTYCDGAREAVKWYQGRSGKVSAKRLAGMVLSVAAVVVGVMSIIFEYKDPGAILIPLLSAAVMLLGSGVAERFGNTGKKKDG